MLVVGEILLGWKSLQVYKGRLISLFIDEKQRKCMERRQSCLAGLELLLPHLPSTMVVPPSDGSQPLNAHLHRLSPLACPCYCLLVLFSLACILVLCPHPDCLLQGGPEILPACSQAMPYLREL